MTKKSAAVYLKDFYASYAAKFLLRMMVVYVSARAINWFWIGAVTPGGFYSSFLDNYLDYPAFVKATVLHTASFVSQFFSAPVTFLDDSTLVLQNGHELVMAWACCGFEMMCFWLAFVLADTTSFKKKTYWLLGGIFAIWFINCLRVIMFIVAKHYRWSIANLLGYHDTFNTAAYALILLMMWVYYRKNSQQFEVSSNQRLETV